jgi:hypothetical protein
MPRQAHRGKASGGLLHCRVRIKYSTRAVLQKGTPVDVVDKLNKEINAALASTRMVCARCGIIGADARPNWQEQPQRESLTGVQWR